MLLRPAFHCYVRDRDRVREYVYQGRVSTTSVLGSAGVGDGNMSSENVLAIPRSMSSRMYGKRMQRQFRSTTTHCSICNSKLEAEVSFNAFPWIWIKSP